MTSYIVRETNGVFWVIDGTTNEPIKSGPYKNRKSAVGRISDLKKKEISAGVHGNLVTPAVQKLAASSEYGKSRPFTVETNPLAAGMNNLDVSGFKITAIGGNPISRPRGVYPAVSKHAYQR